MQSTQASTLKWLLKNSIESESYQNINLKRQTISLIIDASAHIQPSENDKSNSSKENCNHEVGHQQEQDQEEEEVQSDNQKDYDFTLNFVQLRVIILLISR